MNALSALYRLAFLRARTLSLTCLCALFAAGAFADEVAAKREALDKEYAEQLTTLADKCDELGLSDEAKATRSWHIRRTAGRQYLFVPGTNDAAVLKAGSAKITQQWRDKLRSLREARGEELWQLVQRACDEHQAAVAFQLLHEVLRESPDHAQARRTLGYTKNIRGQWQLAGVPASGNGVAVPGSIDHPKLGWRRRSYWRLETPHYNIATNHSPKAAVDLGRQMEDLHALWQQIFFNYWSNEAALAARLAGGNEPLARERPKMNVVLFRNREEYVQQLAPGEPKIPLTLGIYMDEPRTAFFYAGDESLHPTWYHEAAHQLFQESQPGRVSPGKSQNFWIVEGAAMYLESLQRHDGYWTVGGWDADRLQFARYRALAGDFAMPLKDLVTLSRDDVQKSPDIRRIYAHSAGLTHFLLNGAGGMYRDAATEYLTVIYQGRDARDTLAKLTSVESTELDQQYLRYLNLTDADLAGITAPQSIRNLSLGRTAVTDEGLKSLASCTNLVWLDLTGIPITDAGFAHLKDATKLQQLFLEGTKVADASLPVIGQMRELELLDLSALPISDEGLMHLAGLKKLKTLYLTNSPITDAGLVHLKGLKQLETLETAGTKITESGLKQLRASLPKLALEVSGG